MAASLVPLSIEYTLNLDSSRLGNATLGKIETTLDKTDQGFQVHSITKAQGFAALLPGSNRQEKCEFSIYDGILKSQSYSGGRSDTSDYIAKFDWSNRVINFSDGALIDMPDGYIVDNCAMPFAAAALGQLKTEEELNKTLYIVDGTKKRIRGYTFSVREHDVLETKLGNIDTIKIVWQREFKPSRTLSFWLSPENHYAPVKIEERRSSRTTTIVVNRLES